MGVSIAPTCIPLLVFFQSPMAHLADLCPAEWALNRHWWEFLVKPGFQLRFQTDWLDLSCHGNPLHKLLAPGGGSMLPQLESVLGAQAAH